MSKLYIKQKVFSWGDKFKIYNEFGDAVFEVKGEVLSLGKKLHIYDRNSEETAFIHQKLLTFLPKYYISRNGEDIAEVVKEFTVFKAKYNIKQFGWEVNGNVTDHQYQIKKGNKVIAEISKKWLSWGDTYEIDASPAEDIVNVLCVVLIIDAVKAAQDAAASS